MVSQDKKVMWVNCSCRSWQKSIMHDSLEKKSFWQFFLFICTGANRSSCSLLSRSFLKIDMSDLITLLFTKDNHERIPPVANYKRASVIDLLTSLLKKEQKCYSLLKQRVNHTFALSFTKNEQFTWKTDERIPNPAFLPKKKYGIIFSNLRNSLKKYALSQK